MQSLDNLNYQLMGCDFIDKCIAHKKDVHINSVYTLQSLERILKVYNYCVEKGISSYSVANYSNIKNNPNMQCAHTLLEISQLDKQVKQYIAATYGNQKSLPTFSVEGCIRNLPFGAFIKKHCCIFRTVQAYAMFYC